MGPILVDIRDLQRGSADPALGLLRSARAALPDRALIGLADPRLPPLEPAVLSCVDRLCTTPHDAGQAWPECFVRLAPDEAEPSFTARLLFDPALPSVAVDAPPPPQALARYWRSLVDVVVPAGALWPTAAGLRRAGVASRVAVIATTPDLPLCRALRRLGADVFRPQTLPAISPGYGHSLFMVDNTEASGWLLPLLRRYGGSAVLLDSCLLAAYAPAHAAALAARELRRPVPEPELRQWRSGIARPAALLLGEVAEAADHLFVHSAWLAGEIARRHGRAAILVPPTPERLRVRAQAAGLQAESCVWAIEMLRSWGREVRLDLNAPAAETRALAERIGVGDLVGSESGPADLTLVLAMRGQASSAAATGRAIASAGVAEAADRAWLAVVPDQPSPPLLATAIDAALPPSEDADEAARLILAALAA